METHKGFLSKPSFGITLPPKKKTFQNSIFQFLQVIQFDGHQLGRLRLSSKKSNMYIYIYEI